MRARPGGIGEYGRVAGVLTLSHCRRAVTRLGFACHDRPGAAAVGLDAPTPLRTASAPLGGTGLVAV
ncbi:hypothetical protein ACFYZJ_20555 [Streptomyces sp. NPDC001848]|uniref:hypothetical protein n=1 Tax=Streptomyces sp. NPDC001848 TaxID=3364618 RepID=UPI00367C516E